ncbi:hypothetical protein PoB_003537600 [Plakobranchus ocellatus]|uniref:Uncharacterized protein n=1 Tax=Plakobranchus ocellatus TaxID=259542 RepID=A0AAV4AKN6_9GAST|nr:hypothetical protein PoB_003537600 [Plakobranchus ocellatus]
MHQQTANLIALASDDSRKKQNNNSNSSSSSSNNNNTNNNKYINNTATSTEQKLLSILSTIEILFEKRKGNPLPVRADNFIVYNRVRMATCTLVFSADYLFTSPLFASTCRKRAIEGKRGGNKTLVR